MGGAQGLKEGSLGRVGGSQWLSISVYDVVEAHCYVVDIGQIMISSPNIHVWLGMVCGVGLYAV